MWPFRRRKQAQVREIEHYTGPAFGRIEFVDSCGVRVAIPVLESTLRSLSDDDIARIKAEYEAKYRGPEVKQ